MVFLFSRPPLSSASPVRISTSHLTRLTSDLPDSLLSSYTMLELNLCASQHITPNKLIHLSLFTPSIGLRLPCAYLNFTPDTPTPLLSSYATLELNLCTSQHITPDMLIHNGVSLLPPSIKLRLPRVYLNFTPDTPNF